LVSDITLINWWLANNIIVSEVGTYGPMNRPSTLMAGPSTLMAGPSTLMAGPSTLMAGPSMTDDGQSMFNQFITMQPDETPRHVDDTGIDPQLIMGRGDQNGKQ